LLLGGGKYGRRDVTGGAGATTGGGGAGLWIGGGNAGE